MKQDQEFLHIQRNTHVLCNGLCPKKCWNQIRCNRIDIWPIITDKNIESANFLFEESSQKTNAVETLLEKNDVLSIGGFIGKTTDGLETTYERGGSDRTAADLGYCLAKNIILKLILRRMVQFFLLIQELLR